MRMLIPMLSLATATATITVCKAKVTEPVRRQLRKVPFVRDVIKCLYCASHWVAAVLVLLTGPEVGAGSRPMDLIVSWLAVVALSAAVMFIINKSHAHMAWTADNEED